MVQIIFRAYSKESVRQLNESIGKETITVNANKGKVGALEKSMLVERICTVKRHKKAGGEQGSVDEQR